jgi:hypothetical protein
MVYTRAAMDSWVKLALQGAGLVAKARQRGVHRRRRERRPMIGMMLHIDGSRHRWLGGEQWHDLLVVLDGRGIDLDGDGGICTRWSSNAGFSASCIAIAPATSG